MLVLNLGIAGLALASAGLAGWRRWRRHVARALDARLMLADDRRHRTEQEEFTRALQGARTEREAQRMLKRQLERTLTGGSATILNRNNSANRLEAVTSVPADSPRFASTVIHDHDRFSFGSPYAPFTWIRSVPIGWRASPPIRSITVRVRTGDRRYAGTDDNVYLSLANGLRFSLEKRAYNDFERDDDDDTYAVTWTR